MSRKVVRGQIAAFLDPAEIEILSGTFPHPPQVTPEGQWYIDQAFGPTGVGTGALIFIHLALPQQEKIIANKLLKWRQYTVRLLCYTRSVKKTSQEAGEDNDTFLDSLTARIQSDPNFGTAPTTDGQPGEIQPGMIFQAGLGGTEFGFDIRIETDVPRLLDAQQTEIFSTCDFECCEVMYTNPTTEP